MRLVLLSLAASLVAASPALANEGRIEGRGGVIWGSGNSEAIAGIAAGYDWDMGSKAFVGLEVSGDKILESNTRVAFGAAARAGLKTSEAGKLYAIGGYATKPCKFCEESWNLGAGYEHKLSGNIYGKVEYRHNFVGNNIADTNVAGVGLGLRF